MAAKLDTTLDITKIALDYGAPWFLLIVVIIGVGYAAYKIGMKFLGSHDKAVQSLSEIKTVIEVQTRSNETNTQRLLDAFNPIQIAVTDMQRSQDNIRQSVEDIKNTLRETEDEIQDMRGTLHSLKGYRQ